VDQELGGLGHVSVPAAPEGAQPILRAVCDNGRQMTSGSMALHAIAMHFGRPGVPTDQAPVADLDCLKSDAPRQRRVSARDHAGTRSRDHVEPRLVVAKVADDLAIRLGWHAPAQPPRDVSVHVLQPLSSSPTRRP
jgi:hypothetical protein